MSLLEQLDKNNIPKHVAIIMDGNGRWAKKQGKMRVFGHASGVESVREALVGATEAGVKHLTLYAFSTENWNRPKFEVNALMELLVKTIAKEVDSLNKNNVRLTAIGNIEELPKGAIKALKNAIERTKNNTRVNLVLALNYSSRWEITNATKNIAKAIESKNLTSDEINTDIFSSYLDTKDIPDPELLIRTSGEYRISNFLLWQIAYSELYFTDKFWPEFKKEDFFAAIIDYQQRERRFGMVSEQIKSKK